MDTPLYKVIFSGDLEEGHAPDVVKRQCAALFKKPVAQIEPLFAGLPVTIKSGLTRQQAEKYVRALRDIGAKARIAVREAKIAHDACRIALSEDKRSTCRVEERNLGAAVSRETRAVEGFKRAATHHRRICTGNNEYDSD